MFSSTKQNADLGQRIRKARTVRKLTVGGLAEGAGLSTGFISQVENGRSNPSIESLRAIAAALQLPLGTLLGEDAVAGDLPAALEAGPSVAKIYRTPLSGAEASGVHLLPGSERGNRVLVQLLPSGALVPRALNAGAGAAFCLVIEGRVSFSQSPQSALLSQGDSARWDPSRRFIFENRGREVVLLFQEYPQGAALPVAMDRVFLAREEATAGPRSYPPEGPLRLAAMRAERHRTGGG